MALEVPLSSMGATAEAHQHPAEEYRASSLKRPLTLRRRNLKLSLDPDGSMRFLESLSERRLLFGREQLSFYRAKAGILLQAQRTDWKVRATPSDVTFTGPVFDTIEVTQRIGVLPAPVEGHFRVVSLRNGGSSPASLRLICLQDPTAAHFRDSQFPWGSLGVNAFNRSSHVALDEVADPPSARVIGSTPGPKLIFMTTDRAKATDSVAAGELPEQTAGMSGQVLVVAQHDLEIPAGGTIAVPMLALYDQSKLETALANFERLRSSSLTESPSGFSFACSSSGISAAARWAASALEGVRYEPDELDRYEVLRTLPYVDPESARAIVAQAKDTLTKDGWARHALDATRPGFLETSALLFGASTLALLSPDKKYPRSIYPIVRKLATALARASHDGVLTTDPSLPQGWRRMIGKGYPTGEVPEVSLSVAAALTAASSLALRLSKTEDSARWAESSKVIVNSLKKRTVDERGLLALSMDGVKLRTEETVDQAVACYRNSLGSPVESRIVRRLLERDFESGWGPRTVPTSNRVYFNPSYGEGQLGGYWTRAALAHVIAAYRSGLAGIGGAELEAVSRLSGAEGAKLGCSPGDFPYWVEPQRRESHGPGSDPVAAARFLEAIIGCELGFTLGSGGREIIPNRSSRLKWLLLGGIFAGKQTNVFLGNSDEGPFVFHAITDCKSEKGWSFAGSEDAIAEEKTVSAATFFSPGQTVCVGNTLDSPAKTKVSFKPRDHALSRHLSVRLQRLDKKSGSWEDVSAIRVFSPMTFEAALGPSDWAAFRLSTGS